jgi:hypothetical protein
LFDKSRFIEPESLLMTIHRRATSWEHGEVPEGLLNLCREHAGKAVSWNALARAGRGGYKHVGLEIEVVDTEPAEDVAGAILGMVVEHSSSQGTELYRVDAYDESGARLGDTVLRIGGDGGADEVDTSGGGGGRWALRALTDTHNRHMATLDHLAKMVEMVAQCLEAMGGAVAQAAEAKMAYASNEAEVASEQHRHDKQMRMMELLATHMSASKEQATGGALGALLDKMPADVKDTLFAVLGELYSDMVDASQETDPEIRKAKLQACIERITSAQKTALGARVPADWQARLLAAWRAELA